MSLILEALRKSEAERRRGQAPDLLSEPLAFAPAARPPVHTPPRWAYAAGGVALAALVAWWAWPARTTAVAPPATLRAESPGRDAGRTVTDDRVPGSTAAPADAAQSADATPASAPAGSLPATRPPRTASRPADSVGSATASAAATPDRPSSPSVSSGSPFTTARNEAAERTRVATIAPEIASEPAIAPRREAAPPALPAARLPAPDIARTEPATATVPPAPPRFTSPDRLLRLADLPTEDRQQLPPLKMSMHMFGAAADQRFAIIDGNRVGEGDRVGEALVEAIEADGVMLAWRGRRIRLPVR